GPRTIDSSSVMSGTNWFIVGWDASRPGCSTGSSGVINTKKWPSTGRNASASGPNGPASGNTPNSWAAPDGGASAGGNGTGQAGAPGMGAGAGAGAGETGATSSGGVV